MNIVVKISRKYTNFTIYTLHACAEWNVLTQHFLFDTPQSLLRDNRVQKLSFFNRHIKFGIWKTIASRFAKWTFWL